MIKKDIKFVFLMFIIVAVSQSVYSLKECTLDLPVVGINNYAWIETDYPISTNEEVAYAACKKATELIGDKLCNVAVCVKTMLEWTPPTGAYEFLIHSSSIGHSHSYGGNCNGGSEMFLFAYNTDSPTRLSHCAYPTAPGKIDWYYSGMWRGCHEDGAGTFSCTEAQSIESPSSCGNGIRDLQEDCKNCPRDVSCGLNQVCSTSGQCLNLGTNENCASLGNKCASNEECIDKQCHPKCGNGRKDSGENCNSCYQDVPCEDRRDACSSDNVCIDLDSDENCGAIGNKCDVTPVGSPVGSECSVDNGKAIQKIKETWYSCEYKTCKKQEKVKQKEVSCGDKFCQDGTCGCSTGYEVCNSLQRCVKKKEVGLNQPCGCDFQCEEGFCDSVSGRCVKGLNVGLSSTKSALNVGEETIVSLSVSNPLSQDVQTDMTLSLGDGIELVEILSSDQCSSSQCKLDKKTIPAGGKKDITVKVKANTATTTFMSAFVSYQLGSKKIELEEKTTIRIIECGNGKIEEGETSETCCIDAGCPADNRFYSFSCNKKTKFCDKNLHNYFIYGGIGILVLIFLIIFGIRVVTHHKKHASEKEKKEKREEKTHKKEIKKHEEQEDEDGEQEDEEEKEEISGSIAKEIEHLHTLMRKGAITKKEFEKKKKELLNT